ncbi:hybrid sensor histidine kinase/response regulator, partial [Mesorhizobium sp. M00.F.Ca.ET.216.01.1.1]
LACRDADALTEALDAGAGTALIAEEALADQRATRLFEWLEHQPAWSDFPFILLAATGTGRRSPRGLEALERLGNVVVLERPLNSETLRRAVASGLRARARQYESRRHLAERIEA